eukprot:Hpha_TRINITY_DN8666_c0_g1::TRINITY_DN8666_c0_g1_i2::g.168804::m.168804
MSRAASTSPVGQEDGEVFPSEFQWWRRELQRQIVLAGGGDKWTSAPPEQPTSKPLPTFSREPVPEALRRYRRSYAERFVVKTLCDAPRGCIHLPEGLIRRIASVADGTGPPLELPSVDTVAPPVLPRDMSAPQMAAVSVTSGRAGCIRVQDEPIHRSPIPRHCAKR